MLILAMLAGTAEAGGLLVGASAGPALPLQVDTDSSKGMSIAGFVGYRASVGPLHLRPDAIYRYNTAARASALGVGGAVTFGAPVAFGPYAHIGLGLGGRDGGGAMGDAGVLAEIGMLKPLYLGLSAGWERTALPRDWDDAGLCRSGPCTDLRYAQNWFVARATLGLSL